MPSSKKNFVKTESETILNIRDCKAETKRANVNVELLSNLIEDLTVNTKPCDRQHPEPAKNIEASF